MLGLGVAALAHVGGEGGHPLDHLLADVRVALDEARGVAVVDAEEVVEHEHLAVGGRARADADHRHLHARHDQLGERAGDRLEHDGEASGVLEARPRPA